MKDKIGFVGLGNMGGPMASRLAAAGFDVMAYDINPDALAAAVEAGCTAGADANACAENCARLPGGSTVVLAHGLI